MLVYSKKLFYGGAKMLARNTRKALLPKPEGYVEKPERPRGERKGHNDKKGKTEKK